MALIVNAIIAVLALGVRCNAVPAVFRDRYSLPANIYAAQSEAVTPYPAAGYRPAIPFELPTRTSRPSQLNEEWLAPTPTRLQSNTQIIQQQILQPIQQTRYFQAPVPKAISLPSAPSARIASTYVPPTSKQPQTLNAVKQVITSTPQIDVPFVSSPDSIYFPPSLSKLASTYGPPVFAINQQKQLLEPTQKSEPLPTTTPVPIYLPPSINSQLASTYGTPKLPIIAVKQQLGAQQTSESTEQPDADPSSSPKSVYLPPSSNSVLASTYGPPNLSLQSDLTITPPPSSIYSPPSAAPALASTYGPPLEPEESLDDEEIDVAINPFAGEDVLTESTITLKPQKSSGAESTTLNAKVTATEGQIFGRPSTNNFAENDENADIIPDNFRVRESSRLRQKVQTRPVPAKQVSAEKRRPKDIVRDVFTPPRKTLAHFDAQGWSIRSKAKTIESSLAAKEGSIHSKAETSSKSPQNARLRFGTRLRPRKTQNLI